jgi:aminoglycoside phosphotransferase family enzyme
MVKAAEQKFIVITALMDPGLYHHPVEELQLIETHISWVILTGPYVYKIKKPVNLGFLDFSTLEKRRFYCEEELRLNQRLAPEIYLAVVPITGTTEQPQIAGRGEAIEYAVKMVQFPQRAQLDRVLSRDGLEPQYMDVLASLVADFHQRIEVAGADSEYGDPEHVYQPVAENFAQIRERISKEKYRKLVDDIEQWSKSAFASLRSVLQQRKSAGFIRECHGDMHLRNIAWVNDQPVIFDCIEFNPNLRWIDVISEVAFLVMDLQDRQQAQLAQRFLNSYLEYSGDYAGVRVLCFYLVYRAMVRAKVEAIRAQQKGISKKEQTEAETGFFTYLELAQHYTRIDAPRLLITHGLSASGKSTLTQPLLEYLPAIRIRSDVERKRLFGIKADENRQADNKEGIYTPEATQTTYKKLIKLAEEIIDAGYSVIVDATFLKQDQRQPFQQLAGAKPCVITIDTEAPFDINELVGQIRALA